MGKERDLDYANICLEEWAKWKIENDGYPSKSPILKLGDNSERNAKSAIPIGVEPRTREVNLAGGVLGVMLFKGGKSAERSKILKQVNVARADNKSVIETIKELKLNISEGSYYRALNEFTDLLEEYI